MYIVFVSFECLLLFIFMFSYYIFKKTLTCYENEVLLVCVREQIMADCLGHYFRKSVVSKQATENTVHYHT